MKKYISITLTAAVAVLSLASCKNFLEQAPVMSQSDALTLSTIEGLDKSVQGTFSVLTSTDWYGSDWILYNEMKTSNGKKHIGSSFDSGRLNDYYNVSFSANNTTNLYQTAYYVIANANNVIENLGDKGTEAQRNNLKAECLFIRALSHFDLVLTFAQPYNYTPDASHIGVPVVLKTETGALPSRNTVKEVYDQIIADLTEAEKLIEDGYVRDGIKDKRAAASKEAVQALLSRVYLYKEDWANAARYADIVIKSGKFSLWAPEDLADAKCYRQDVGSGEVIFEVWCNTANEFDPNGNHTGLFSMTTPNGYSDGGCSSDIVSRYEDGDARLALYELVDDTYWFTKKYAGKGIVSKDDPVNTIVLRLSEMYLTRAEAAIKGNLPGYDAVSDLKAIAAARNATAQPATAAGVAAEREKEFAWEGHLWFDLGRTKTPMKRTDVAASNIVKEIPVGDYRWTMPIPDHEISANKNIVQNEGY